MASILLKPRPGLSAPIVANIPDDWDSQWFRRFITNYLGFRAVSYPKFSPALGNSAVAANVLTLFQQNYYELAPVSAQTISSIKPVGVADNMYYIVRVSNANVTFQNGASLKMSGSANFTPGANGATLHFLIDAGITWEIGRVAY